MPSSPGNDGDPAVQPQGNLKEMGNMDFFLEIISKGKARKHLWSKQWDHRWVLPLQSAGVSCYLGNEY